MLSILEVLEMHTIKEVKEVLERNGFEFYEWYSNGETLLNGYNKETNEVIHFSHTDTPDEEVINTIKDNMVEVKG